MADKGWIKLYRDIQDNTIWNSNQPFDRRSAWIDLILMANHKDNNILYNGKLITIRKGQVLTSEVKLSEKWHWSRARVRRFILLLVELKMITKESTSTDTTLTLVNYSKFQNSRTSSDTGHDTSSDTSSDTGHDTQTRMKKNEKECKEREIASQYDSDDDYVSEEEWQRRLAEQDDDW